MVNRTVLAQFCLFSWAFKTFTDINLLQITARILVIIFVSAKSGHDVGVNGVSKKLLILCDAQQFQNNNKHAFLLPISRAINNSGLEDAWSSAFFKSRYSSYAQHFYSPIKTRCFYPLFIIPVLQTQVSSPHSFFFFVKDLCFFTFSISWVNFSFLFEEEGSAPADQHILLCRLLAPLAWYLLRPCRWCSWRCSLLSSILDSGNQPQHPSFSSSCCRHPLHLFFCLW